MEWWDTYHADKPVAPPTVAAAPPQPTPPVAPRPQPVVQLPPEMPQVVAAPSAPAPKVARKPGPRPAVRRAPLNRPTLVVMPAVAPAEAAPAPVPAPEPMLAPLPAMLGDAALRQHAAAAMAAHDPAQAAADWAELLRRQPGDVEARRGLVLALQAVGLPELALETAGSEAGFSPAEWAALQGDAAARAVELAVRGEPRPERNRILRARRGRLAARRRLCRRQGSGARAAALP